MVMRGYKEVSWKQAKGMMSEANFLKSLTEMDVDGITSTQVPRNRPLSLRAMLSLRRIKSSVFARQASPRPEFSARLAVQNQSFLFS